MVGAKGKNIFIFYFLRAFFILTRYFLSEQVFQKDVLKRKEVIHGSINEIIRMSLQHFIKPLKPKNMKNICFFILFTLLFQHAKRKTACKVMRIQSPTKTYLLQQRSCRSSMISS